MSYIVTGTFALPYVGCVFVIFASTFFDVEALVQVSQLAKLHSHQQATIASNQEKAYANPDLLKQKSESAHELLPNVSKVLLGSSKVFKTLNVQLHTIQSQLNAMQNGDAASIAEQTAEYEQQLEVQRAEIATAEAMNAKTMNATEELRKINKGLRKKASALAGANQKVRLSITQMQNNASIAMEFMQNMMDVSETLLNATEMQVMKELDVQDTLMQKRLAREKSLNLIGMLQFGSVRRSATEKRNAPANLVQGMFTALEDYAKEKAAHENELKAMFERRIQAGTDQLQALHDEYKQLKTTYQAEKERQGRLITAVGHLEKTYRQLTSQKQSLAKFFHNMG